jgi:hypothetical protein
MRHVAVMGFESDDQKHILVVVCLNPIDAYCNKDNKHIGHIREGKLVPVKDTSTSGCDVSERESDMVMRCYQALRVALDAIHV